MEMVDNDCNCNLESTACCTSCQILFVDVQLCPGHTCSPCMEKDHLSVPVTQLTSIFPSFQCLLISGLWSYVHFFMKLPNFQYLLQNVIQHCGGPLMLT